jgi:alpha-mannosidase
VSLPFDLRILLWSEIDRVDFALELENRARDHRLRVFLRAPFEADRFEVESAFEVVERPIAPERDEAGDRTPAEYPIGATPQRSFAMIADARTALTLANRGLAEVEAVPEPDGTTCLALTVLRAVGWLSRSDLVKRPGHAGPPLETPKAQVPGAHEAEFSFRLHEPDAPARVVEAHRFAYPPLAAPIVGTALDPLLEDGARLVAIDDPEVVVSAVEPRKNGASLVRLYNATSRERRVSLAWRSARRLSRVDLAETPDRTSGFEDSGSSATLQLAPWQLASISVTPA